MPRRSSPLRNVPQIVSQIPRFAYRSPEVLNPEVEKRFLLVLLGQLTPDEHVELERLLTCSETERKAAVGSAIVRSIHAKVDELLINQVVTFGWTLTQTAIASDRFKAWDNDLDGPDKIMRFARAWKRSVLISQGKQNAPDDDPTLYVFKQETVPQLRQVLRQLHHWFAVQRMSVSNDALIKQFETIVRSDAGVFHLAGSNLDLWLAFLRSDPRYLLTAISASRHKPGSMFDDWWTWLRRRNDAKKTRDNISKLAPIASAVFVPRLNP